MLQNPTSIPSFISSGKSSRVFISSVELNQGVTGNTAFSLRPTPRTLSAMLEWLPYDHIATRPDLVEARVLLVPPKLGATAVSLLPSQTGLEPSLKRIRPHRCPSPASSLELLVCLWTDQPAPALLQLASPCSHCAVTEIRTLVPAGPAYTREQCQAWSKFWPCAFKQSSLLPLQQRPEET